MNHQQGNQQRADSLDQLSARLGVPLPPGAKVVWSQHESGIDTMARAKLQLSAAQFEALRPQLPIDVDTLTEGAGRLGSDHEAWNPHATPGIRAGQVQQPAGRYLNVGVARAADGTVTLFLMSHST